jgi:hypothetical protein
MTVKKYYYSLHEVSILLDLTIDDLMHYGITGQLGMFFDWALIKNEISINNLPLKLIMEFKGHPAHLWQRTIDDTLNSDHVEQPINRLFILSTGQLSVINKHGSIPLINAYDEDIELSLEIVKLDEDPQVEYPKLNLTDIIVSSEAYEYFVKNNKLDNAVLDSKLTLEDDDMPDNLYFANSLNKEVWPIPDNMNLPTKSELGELLLIKDPNLCKADIDAIIRNSTPNGIRLGGKRKKDKIDFAPILRRKLI